MKKALSVLVSLVMVFAFTAVSFAAEKGEAPAPAEKKVEKTHHVKKTVHHRRIVGEVGTVDAAAGTITVKHKKGEVTVTVYAKTRIRTGKLKKSIEDVKAGQKVTVRYKEEKGKNVATSVYIWKTAKKVKKVKKAKKAGKAVKTAEKKEAAPAEKQDPAK